MFGFKKKVKIKLVKEGKKDVIITCPENIKLGFMDLYAALRLDIPPLNVKPINFLSVILMIILYALIFVTPAILIAIDAPDVVLILLSVGILAANIIINRNYYWNVIRKKLKEGYEPKDKESWTFLDDVKMPDNISYNENWNLVVENSVNQDLSTQQIEHTAEKATNNIVAFQSDVMNLPIYILFILFVGCGIYAILSIFGVITDEIKYFFSLAGMLITLLYFLYTSAKTESLQN
ncbi:MAG TPA: hypothetical protein PK067_09455 [Kaistella chaponensis]|nr:hypothetical protein [Kaistella chaponensis]